MTMTPAISIALLLLSATVVKSWRSLEDQTEAEGDFSSQFQQYVRESADHHEEKKGDKPNPPCMACKFIVSEVEKKLGGNKSKEKIGNLLTDVCTRASILRTACKEVIKKSKNELIDGIAEGGASEKICVKLRWCE